LRVAVCSYARWWIPAQASVRVVGLPRVVGVALLLGVAVAGLRGCP